MKSVFAFLLFFILLPYQKEHIPVDFVYLRDIIPGIALEMRYYSTNNFVGGTIDGYLANRCIISKEAALAISKVQADLISDGYGLKIFDAYRPQRAVDHFVGWSIDLGDQQMKQEFYPEIDKSVLFEQGYISSKSGHSRGSTVDLTIIYSKGPNKGEELDMGTSWDFFSPLSWPTSNEVSPAQKANRMLLQKVMVRHGFEPLKEEWWHFTLVNEPFPDTYFDFPVE